MHVVDRSELLRYAEEESLRPDILERIVSVSLTIANAVDAIKLWKDGADMDGIIIPYLLASARLREIKSTFIPRYKDYEAIETITCKKAHF